MDCKWVVQKIPLGIGALPRDGWVDTGVSFCQKRGGWVDTGVSYCQKRCGWVDTGVSWLGWVRAPHRVSKEGPTSGGDVDWSSKAVEWNVV